MKSCPLPPLSRRGIPMVQPSITPLRGNSIFCALSNTLPPSKWLWCLTFPTLWPWGGFHLPFFLFGNFLRFDCLLHQCFFFQGFSLFPFHCWLARSLFCC